MIQWIWHLKVRSKISSKAFPCDMWIYFRSTIATPTRISVSLSNGGNPSLKSWMMDSNEVWEEVGGEQPKPKLTDRKSYKTLLDPVSSTVGSGMIRNLLVSFRKETRRKPLWIIFQSNIAKGTRGHDHGPQGADWPCEI
ncbi:hypothetical protein NE237_032544 [Protea cynaroides]|uniref:Uncharacterized protein n=1 Tax=Protea cynaroides TaxID=273540 RepID=A0A9Q0L3I5_9MAGN|nr:hypothetical protein NE237_032544 [Protea cynaroides]